MVTPTASTDTICFNLHWKMFFDGNVWPVGMMCMAKHIIRHEITTKLCTHNIAHRLPHACSPTCFPVVCVHSVLILSLTKIGVESGVRSRVQYSCVDTIGDSAFHQAIINS